MERIIRKLLFTWVLLLSACLLTQAFPFSGSARLGYWLLLMLTFTSPVVVSFLFLRVGLGLREAVYRLRVLRRAGKWKRKESRTPWTREGWDA